VEIELIDRKLPGLGSPVKPLHLLLLAATLAVAVVALPAGASAAPSRPVTAQETLETLQASGYRVIVNRIGTLPLDQCIVTATRPGRTVTRTKSLSDDYEQEILYTTVYLDTTC
jgi:hypothetical protein